MPLAAHDRVVAVVGEDLGEGGDAVVEYALVAGMALVLGSTIDGLGHLAEASKMVVGAAEEHAASGRARRCGVEACEPHTGIVGGGEAVEVGGGDLAAKGASVAEAEVVGNDDEEVGARRWHGVAGRQGRRRAGERRVLGGRQGVGGLKWSGASAAANACSGGGGAMRRPTRHSGGPGGWGWVSEAPAGVGHQHGPERPEHGLELELEHEHGPGPGPDVEGHVIGCSRDTGQARQPSVRRRVRPAPPADAEHVIAWIRAARAERPAARPRRRPVRT